LAEDHHFQIVHHQIDASVEQLRSARRVTVAVIQNAVVLEPSAPVHDQIRALHLRIRTMVEAAAHCSVNVICFQETWSKMSFDLFLPLAIKLEFNISFKIFNFK
jgi:beta-ureidopropionase